MARNYTKLRVFKVETADKKRPLTINLDDARMRPLEPFPPSLHEPWWVECHLCHTQMAMTPLELARGARCRCVDAHEAAIRQGYQPEGPCPDDWHTRWPLRCEVCGPCAFTPRMVMDGLTPCQHRITEASDTVHAAGMVPLEPFCGTARRPWAMACQVCEARRQITLARIARGWRCRHSVPTGPAGEMLEAGYLPQEEFPGVYRPWAVMCMECGRGRRKRLYAIRRDGDPCRHKPCTTHHPEKKDLAQHAFRQYTEAATGD